MLVWAGEPVPEDDRTRSFRDDPKIPDWSKVATRRYRGGIRREPIDTIGVHTWRALPARDSTQPGSVGLVHYDPARHKLRAAEVISGHRGTLRKAAYHIYIDHDGSRTQCADPATWWTYHGAKNSRSLGIGIAQGSRSKRGALPDSLVTIEAVDSAAELIELLFDAGKIVGGSSPSITTCGWKPPIPPSKKAPSQTIPVARCLELWAAFGRLVLGHGHCGKKTHDPGQHVWERLLSRPGWQQVWP